MIYLYIVLAVVFVALLAYYLIYRDEINYSTSLYAKYTIYIPPSQLRNVSEPEFSLKKLDVAELHNRITIDHLDVDLPELIVFNIKGGDVHKLVSALHKIDSMKISAIDKQDLFDVHRRDQDIERFTNIIAKLHTSEVKCNIESLIRRNMELDDMDKVVNALIRSTQAGFPVSQDELITFFEIGGDVEKFENAMVKSRQLGLDLDADMLIRLAHTGCDVEKFVEILFRCHHIGLDIPLKSLVSHRLSGDEIIEIAYLLIRCYEAKIPVTIDQLLQNKRIGGNPVELVDAIVKAKELGINTSIKELERFHISGGNILEYIEALEISVRNELGLSNDRLFDLNIAVKRNMLTLVKALAIAKSLNIDPTLVEKDFIKGRNVQNILFAVRHARSEGIDFSYNFALKLDRNNHDVKKIILETLNPRVVQGKPVQVVVHDGIRLRIIANISLCLNIYNFFTGSGEDILFDRINEAIIEECERYNNHQEVLANMNRIANSVRNKINGDLKPRLDSYKDKFTLEEEIKEHNELQRILNRQSKFRVMDINIPEVEIEEDTTENIRRSQVTLEAELKKLQAEADLLAARTAVEQATADALKSGRGLNEIHKKGIFDRFDREAREKERRLAAIAERRAASHPDAPDTAEAEVDAKKQIIPVENNTETSENNDTSGEDAENNEEHEN